MKKYSTHFNPNVTPQSEQADSKQVKNNNGGYSFKVDKWSQLNRFLVLGSSGGSYYVSERKLTRENAQCVLDCVKENPVRAVNLIVEISDKGKAPKNDPAIFALALCASTDSVDTNKMALEALPKVCRTGTHLFQFCESINEFRGWGRSLKTAVGKWYEDKTVEQLTYQVLKYQQREGWSHRDVLRLAHVDPHDSKQPLYRWIVGSDLSGRIVDRKKEGIQEYSAVSGELPELIQVWEKLKKGVTAKEAVDLIHKHKLTHEMIPGDLKAHAEVWEALAQHMPLHALVRNLGSLTSKQVIAPLSANAKMVVSKLSNVELLKKSRMHPLSILVALNQYRAGKGSKGSLIWSPVSTVLDALDSAFYSAFDFVEPTNKNFLLAVDVSSSMTWSDVAGMTGISPRIGSAVMAMVTARTEPNYHIMGFSHTLVPLKITAKSSLSQAIDVINNTSMGGTDCALPMVYAQRNKLDVDVFVTYTDSDTGHGMIHPHQALKQYRQTQNPLAKSVVCAMLSNAFTVADPNDAGQLDIVGFSTDVPTVLADFAKG